MRFFVPNLSKNSQINLPDGVYAHWVRVLRACVGDSAVLFDGTGGEYVATLTHIDKKSASAQIGEFNPINRNLSVRVRIAQGVARGDKMEQVITKACELGAWQICPIITTRTQNPKIYKDKQPHWQKIAVSACEQCGLNIIPKVYAPMTLGDFIALDDSTHKIVLATPKGTRAVLPDFCTDGSSISLVVGAEGGLTSDEMAKLKDYHRFSLGARVLRTETAAIAMLAIINHHLDSA